jgi:rhodanese-related sulfurtransferase
MARTLRETFILLLLTAVCATGTAFFHPKKPSWNSGELTLAVARGLGEKTLWIDARRQVDYDAAHIPGALLLNEDAWDSLIPAVLDAWQEGRAIVVYCSSSGCHTSREVARRLREEVQLPDVFVLQGGWEAWRQAGGGLEK